MKKLTLLRHAKSSWDDPSLDDFDRPLNRRGRRAAEWIGIEMSSRDLYFDKILASPARRVVETIDGGNLARRASSKPVFDPAIYAAEARTLLDLLRQLDDNAASVLLVGHNPGLQSLALVLCAKTDPRRAPIETRFPTACLVAMQFGCGRWSEVANGNGTIELVLVPPK